MTKTYIQPEVHALHWNLWYWLAVLLPQQATKCPSAVVTPISSGKS